MLYLYFLHISSRINTELLNFIAEESIVVQSVIVSVRLNTHKKQAMIGGSDNNFRAIANFPRLSLNFSSTFKLNGENYTIVGIREKSFMNSSIFNITLPSSITYIGFEAFKYATQLEYADLSQTKINKLFRFTFSNCINLKTLLLPKSIASFGSGVFTNCSLLSSADFFSSFTIQLDEEAFFNCSSIRTINLSTSLLSAIPANCFAFCSLLDEVFFPPSLKTISTKSFMETSIRYLKQTKLKSLESYSFTNCYSLTEVDLSNTKCYDIPSFCFQGCCNLITLILPRNIDKIQKNSFQYTSITTLRATDKLISLHPFAFANCQNLQIVNLSLTQLTKINNNVFAFSLSIKAIIFPHNLQDICFSAFYQNSIEELVFPPTVNFIGAESFGYSFLLRSVDLSNTNITSLEKSFIYSPLLENIILPKTLNSLQERALAYLPSLTKISLENYNIETFYYNITMQSGLRYIKFPASTKRIYSCCLFETPHLVNVDLSLTEIQKIPSRMFVGCRRLNSIIFPPNATKLGIKVFSGSGLMRLSLPSSFNTLSEKSFADCEDIVKISLKETKVTTISESCFYGCTSLKFVEFPSCLNMFGTSSFMGSGFSIVQPPESLEDLGISAFKHCISLEIVDLSLTKIKKISAGAFEDCAVLAWVYLPIYLSQIGDSAFWNCPFLKAVYYGGIENIERGNVFSDLADDSIKVFVSSEFNQTSFCGIETSVATVFIPPFNVTERIMESVRNSEDSILKLRSTILIDELMRAAPPSPSVKVKTLPTRFPPPTQSMTASPSASPTESIAPQTPSPSPSPSISVFIPTATASASSSPSMSPTESKFPHIPRRTKPPEPTPRRIAMRITKGWKLLRSLMGFFLLAFSAAWIFYAFSPFNPIGDPYEVENAEFQPLL